MPPRAAIPNTSQMPLPRRVYSLLFLEYTTDASRSTSKTPHLHLTTPHHAIPATAPATMATAGGTFHQLNAEYVTPTTHQGSHPRLVLFPCFTQPISQRRYTAVKARPSAVEFTPRTAEVTDGFERRARQRAWKPSEMARGGDA